MIIVDEDEKTYSMLCHLLALGIFVIPLGNIFGPLIIWLIKKDSSEIINSQGKEALNFQATITIGVIISIPFCIILIGFAFIAALIIVDLVFIIIASVKAYEGYQYTYPWSIKFFK